MKYHETHVWNMQDLMEQGLQAYENKDFETAVRLLQQALPLVTDSAERERIRIRLASAYDELKRYPEALAVLKEALEENPDSAPAWNNIGVVCRRLGKLDDARNAYERAFKLDPENADHLINLGSTCLKLSDPGNALQYLKLAIELVPGHPVAHANLALTYAVFGRLEEAEDALRLAILYGFEQSEVIQKNIDALKKLRDDMKTSAPSESGADAEGTEAPPASGEIELLVQLEKDMFTLAESRYGEEKLPEEKRKERDMRMIGLRKQIRSLRRKLGMEEVSESDVVGGVNYMRDDEETG